MADDDRTQDLPETSPNRTADGVAPAEPFEAACLKMLRESAARQTELGQELANLAGQNAFQRQQFVQLYDAVRQLYDAVSLQCRQLLQSDQAIKQEMERFQTGGPQRAMAGVFHKLFRDLVQHAAELDDLLTASADHRPTEAEAAWIEAVRILRDRFETRLKDWGATPIAVRVGEEEFDPEIHEAAAPNGDRPPSSLPENVIVRVRRRGWSLHGNVLVAPLVEVS